MPINAKKDVSKHEKKNEITKYFKKITCGVDYTLLIDSNNSLKVFKL